ncbi:MAG: hypothetical protein R3F48_02865 [Candidatus Zixiibacteriota bacterium]
MWIQSKRFAFTILLITAVFYCLTGGAAISANEPVGLAAYTLGLPQFDWQTRTSEHFRIHYLPNSAAASVIDELIDRNERTLRNHLSILQELEYRQTIDLFYFDSREQIKEVVTKPFRALADAASLTVLAVRSETDIARDAHELMHVVSFDLWGGWQRRDEIAWLSEGLATFSDIPCNGYDMTELAAHILSKTDKGAPLDSLASNFRDYPEMIGYVLMASFVDYIMNTYGAESLKELWKRGYAEIEKVLGKDKSSIESDWHKFVHDRYPNPQVSDWPDLEQNGCK